MGTCCGSRARRYGATPRSRRPTSSMSNWSRSWSTTSSPSASAAPCSSSTRRPAAGRSAIQAIPTSSFAAARPSPACPIAHTTRASPISRPICAASGGRSGVDRSARALRPGLTRFDTAYRHWLQSRRLPKPVIERVAGAANGADRIGIVTAVERLAQPAHMDVDGALVDVDFAAPHAVEELFAREYATGPLHQKFEQAIFGRAEIDRAAGARDPLLLAVDLEVAEGQHVREPLGQRAPQ